MATASPRPLGKIETFELGPLTAPRIWMGLWQLSSNAWGSASVRKIQESMRNHLKFGYSAFDMADHYGSAEIIFGQFRRSLPSTVDDVIGATKWCLFKSISPTRSDVEFALQERMDRMLMDHVDLLQFHWQNYSDRGYLTALRILNDLRNEGKISALGLCNFDAVRTDEICTALGPGCIVSNQVQFSLIDTRPIYGMGSVCEKHNMKLLTYGTLCGGFLSDSWLGKQEPDLYTGNLTPSQRKYLDMIVKAWGSWDLLQTLLATLRRIGDRHCGMSISNIATRWILDHHFVGAVILGARMGISEHTVDNLRIFEFQLTEDDKAEIHEVLIRSNGPRLITTIGDCGAEYR